MIIYLQNNEKGTKSIRWYLLHIIGCTMFFVHLVSILVLFLVILLVLFLLLCDSDDSFLFL